MRNLLSTPLPYHMCALFQHKDLYNALMSPGEKGNEERMSEHTRDHMKVHLSPVFFQPPNSSPVRQSRGFYRPALGTMGRFNCMRSEFMRLYPYSGSLGEHQGAHFRWFLKVLKIPPSPFF